MAEFGQSLNRCVNGGRFINFRLAPGEFLVTCPYDSSHRITNARIGIHLAKCRRNWKKRNSGVEMQVCRYNCHHIYPQPEIQFHEETCSDAATILDHLVYLSTDSSLESRAIKNDTVKKNKSKIEEEDAEEEDTKDVDKTLKSPSNKSDTKECCLIEEEDWEEECERNRALNIIVGYDPRLKLRREAGLIIQSLPGISTYSEREEFRARQAQIFFERNGGDFNDADVSGESDQLKQQRFNESKDFEQSSKIKRPASPIKQGEPPVKKRLAHSSRNSPKIETSTSSSLDEI